MGENFYLDGVALVIFALTACAHAADDTVRFYGVWITKTLITTANRSLWNLSTTAADIRITCVSPASATPAGSGSFSAANGKWAAAAAAPTIWNVQFTDDYTIAGTNSAGQAVILWRTLDDPLPWGLRRQRSANVGGVSASRKRGRHLGDEQHGRSLCLRPRRGPRLQPGDGLVPKGRCRRRQGCDEPHRFVLLQRAWACPRITSRRWRGLSKAAAAGDDEGMGNVGALYGGGLGVPKDYPTSKP